MVLVDANVLLYAVNESSPRHRVSSRWIENALSGDEPVGLAWGVLLAFVRIATLRAAVPSPLEAAQAMQLVDDWLAAPAARTVGPTVRHPVLLRGLLSSSGSGGNLVVDAHLAALSIEHGARICSFDRDFDRFPGVRVCAPR